MRICLTKFNKFYNQIYNQLQKLLQNLPIPFSLD